LTLLGPAGINIGAVIAYKYGSRIGIRRLLLIVNAAAIVANMIKIVENSVCVFIGRFFFSMCVGAANVGVRKAISETVPSAFALKYGIHVNSGIQLGVIIS
jgi:hypothetical protein